MATPMVQINGGVPNNVASLDEQKRKDAEQFGQYVTQRLCRQPDDLKRRKLENAIQEAIARTEKALFE